MKKWIAILLMLCLMAGTALAETGATPEPPAEAAADEAAEVSLPDPDTVEAEAEAEEVEADDEAAEEEPAPEPTEEAPQSRLVWFEEGFGLNLPDGWVSYPVSDTDRHAGVRYALGDGSGERYLYIQALPTRLTDPVALSDEIEQSTELSLTGDLEFGGVPFSAFIDEMQNVSGCATLWGGEIVMFLFTPQSDSAYMMQATEIMESFSRA